MLSGRYCLLLSNCHPHVAELAKVKRMYEEEVFEMDKLKQKLKESQTTVAKVCSLLVVLFWGQRPHSMDKWGSLLLMYFL